MLGNEKGGFISLSFCVQVGHALIAVCEICRNGIVKYIRLKYNKRDKYSGKPAN